MDLDLRKHAMNLDLYDDVDDYVQAASTKAKRILTAEEVDYLMDTAEKQGVGRPGVLRGVGEFTVCNKCAKLLRQSNDVFRIVNARAKSGNCDVCGQSDLRRTVAVDNFGKVARITVKQAEVLAPRSMVKIVNAPVRYQPLIGETAEIISRQMTGRGPLYTVMLGSGDVIPVPFKHMDLEPVNSPVIG